MSDRWGKLQDRYKAKGMDLDAEFEKFMNEVSYVACVFFFTNKSLSLHLPELFNCWGGSI